MTEESRKRARKACAEYRRRNPEKIRSIKAKYRRENREKIRAYVAKYLIGYRVKNRERMRRYRAEHYRKNKARYLARPRPSCEQQRAYFKKYKAVNREKIAIWARQYYEKNRARILARCAARAKQRRRECPYFRLKLLLRSRFYKVLKVQGVSKSMRVTSLVGCTPDELKTHLEKQFLPGMSWDNHGQWHIDHIRPISSFDLHNHAQQSQCFHFSNLQPLWAKDNLKKGSRVYQELQYSVEDPAPFGQSEK